jgi:hypothetical protein
MQITIVKRARNFWAFLFVLSVGFSLIAGGLA